MSVYVPNDLGVRRGDAAVSGAGATEGERASLEVAYARYAPYVARMALRLLGRSDEVDDLIQDVFLAASEHRGTVEGADSVKAWLATVTVNKARNRLRFRRFKVFFSLDGGTLELPATAHADPSARLLLERVFQALDGAATEARLAWSLRYLEELSLSEVASLCHCSLATAKRRIAAAQAIVDQEVGRD